MDVSHIVERINDLFNVTSPDIYKLSFTESILVNTERVWS
jgi:hypothetical protein